MAYTDNDIPKLKAEGFNVRLGIDGHYYVVFDSEYEAEKHADKFLSCPWSCFGGLFNAFQLSPVE